LLISYHIHVKTSFFHILFTDLFVEMLA